MGRVNAGALNQRIVLLTAAEPVPDGRGGFAADQPDTETAVWARVRPLRAGEKLALGQVLNSEVYEITVRQSAAGLSPKQRVRWQGQTLNVQAVTPDEWGEFSLLTCLRGGQ